MDKLVETWVTAPKRTATDQRDACLVHIYPTSQSMGARYHLDTTAFVLGRGDDCQIQIHEHSVSRRHARIELTADGFVVVDLASTNGTFVNDVPAAHSKLRDGDYLRVGNCIYRFLCGGNLESEYHEEIYRLTIIDGLTGTHNQRYMMEFLDRELARSSRHRRPLALVMIDIDRFKKTNDEFGHLGGDFALRELSDVVTKAIRREDLFCRYGGEEFGLVLIETPHDQARQVADRIRATVAEHRFQYEGKTIPITVSMGIAFTCGEPAVSVVQLIRNADEQLYQAKRKAEIAFAVKTFVRSQHRRE